MRTQNKTLIACLITFIVTVLLIAALLFSLFGGVSGTRYILKLNAVKNHITHRYIGEYDLDKVADAAAKGAVDSLEDRWSSYYSAEGYRELLSFQNNTSKGIGVTVTADEETGGFLVHSVALESSAEAAGILEGDIIIKAAGVDVRNMDTSELRKVLTAQEDEYEIVVIRGDEEISLSITTGTIYNTPVSSAMLEDNIGYVRIRNFYDGCGENAVEAVKELMADGAEGLIFDVRSDPGGYIHELKTILDYILPEGPIFVSVNEKGKEAVTESDASCISIPMAVLIDENSYSAAELFAAALSEYDYAVIVGTPSTGKDRSQQTFELFDGSAVHISTACYLTPVNRIDLAAEGGLKPDISADGSEEEGSPIDAACDYLLSIR